MFPIPGEQLWFGHIGHARDFRAIFDAGITALVDLALSETALTSPHEMVYCRIPLVDGAGNSPNLLRLAIQTTALLVQHRIPTLIYCSAGLSRSPTIAAGALALLSGVHPEESLQRLAALHPLEVTPGLWHDVKEITATMQAELPGK